MYMYMYMYMYICIHIYIYIHICQSKGTSFSAKFHPTSYLLPLVVIFPHWWNTVPH